MLEISIKNVLEHLRQTNHDAQIQAETQQVVCILHLAGRDFPLFVKVDADERVLQILIFMPCMMGPRSTAEVGRLLHFLNKELDLPGFGMDETAGVIFYRCVLPTSDGKVDINLFDSIMVSIPRLAQVFFPVIAAVANGTPFEAIVGQVRDVLKRFAQRS